MTVTTLTDSPWLRHFASTVPILRRKEIEALLCDRTLGGGLLTWTPIGARLRRIVDEQVRARCAGAGFTEITFPLLLPPELSVEVERLRPHRTQMYLVQAPASVPYGLGATYEETYDHWLQVNSAYLSRSALLFQIGPKFRHVDAPRRLVRLRQFTMCDLYAACRDLADLHEVHERFQDAVLRLADWFEVPVAVVEQADSQLAYVQYMAPDGGGEERIPSDGSVRVTPAGATEWNRTSTVAMYMEMPPAGDHAVLPARASYGFGMERLLSLVVDHALRLGFGALRTELRPFTVAVLAHPSLPQRIRPRLLAELNAGFPGDNVSFLFDDATRQSFALRQARARALGCDLVVVVGQREVDLGAVTVAYSAEAQAQHKLVAELDACLALLIGVDQ
jgi:prolyl-tRNA synthetase